MAGLPPYTIHVKRKRGDDEAPDFLEFDGSKRYRSGDGNWAYQRKQGVAQRPSHVVEPSGPAVPVIQPTREGDENRMSRRRHKLAQAPASSDATTPEPAPVVPKAPDQPASTAPSHLIADCRRHFHLSRPNPPLPTAGVSKKRTAAVFIERSAKKQREALGAIVQEHKATRAEQPKPIGDLPAVKHLSSADEKPPIAQQPSPAPKNKRPGNRACTTSLNSKPTLPISMQEREGFNADELARVMNDWTLDEIDKNLKKIAEESNTSKFSPAPKSRFRPKAPTHRRPPSQAAGGAGQQSAAAAPGMDVDVMAGDTDEEDYVVDTYERVPAERLRDQTLPAHRVGLLVFDGDPDMIEFFYGNEEDSDDEFPEDDEDENAENYYTTEYPEEDIDLDDLFDRNPYQYTTQNDSDKEEFDERDFDDSDYAWENSGDEKGLADGFVWEKGGRTGSFLG